MPYTPPSHRSPASSAPASPDASRRPSFATSTPSSPRPSLPRSSSYLTKHRRTPSANAVVFTNGSTPDITPPGTSADLKGLATNHGPVRQSPPPVADTGAMPPMAVISPPESSSEDEGIIEMHQRGREIDNMKELKEAISAIPQCRASSPNRTSAGDLLMLPAQIEELEAPQRPAIITNGLKPESRKVLHSRSHTDGNIFLSMSTSTEASLTASEENSEQDEPAKKPPMVRKKSGELVRPALRPAALRRPSSMPGTPTFGNKAVHFDSHLEHVRHFLQVDRPLAVSAGSSPADNYDSDTEYPFKSEDVLAPRTPPYEWEIVIANFPAETPIRKGLPVRLERVWMSPDQKSLVGSVAVANLAFQKVIVCRFTFDYWKTTSEVGAEFHHEIRPKESETGHDRFQFTIKLSDIADLESKTLYFCIRYNVNGLEYWDNNNNMNFQIDFRKKMLPQNGKKGFQGASSRPANALPRSNRRTNSTTRPRSMPVGSLEDFEHDAKLAGFGQPLHEFLGESEPLRLKNSKSTSSIPSDNLSSRLTTPSGVAFANRYDFGASLTAAKQANKTSSPSPRNGDGLYMKAHKRAAFSTLPVVEAPESPLSPRTMPPPASMAPASVVPVVAPAGPSTLGTESPPSSIASASYEEILNKYCFFNGSKQSSPQLKDGTLQNGRYDGADELGLRSMAPGTSIMVASPTVIDRAFEQGLPQASRQNLEMYFQNAYVTAMSPSQAPLPPSTSTSSGSPSPPGSNSPNRNYVTSSTSTSGHAADHSLYHPQQMQDRFPFMADSHSVRAIKS